MKYFFIILIISACGKYREPPTLDLKDSDGDQILNNIDEDKFLANIMSIDEVYATLEFQTGAANLKKNIFELSNKKDIESNSKDLLVKNKLAIKEESFFSEFSRMDVISAQKDVGQLSVKNRIILNFSKTKNPPNSVYLMTGTTKVKLSEWAESIDISLTQKDLESIIQGKSFIWLSYMDSLPKKPDQIREKSYRVFYNKSNQSEVFYISKDLSINQIAEKLKIDSYKYIDEENLLTTTLKPEVPQWWIRLLDNGDIVFVHANLRELSDHYFQGLQKVNGFVSRINGKPHQLFALVKDLDSRLLLKIRSTRKNANFVETKDDKRKRGGGREEADLRGCIEHTRRFTSEFLNDLSNDEFQQFFSINGILQEQNLINSRYLIDEKGPFWEIEISNLENITLTLPSLSNRAYAQIGHFKDDNCLGSDSSRTYSNNLQSNERSLVLKIEAYLEIIPK